MKRDVLLHVRGPNQAQKRERFIPQAWNEWFLPSWTVGSKWPWRWTSQREPRHRWGSGCCPPRRQQLPSREAITHWFMTRHYARNKVGKIYTQFGVIQALSLLYGQEKKEEGGIWRNRRERFPPVRAQEHLRQAPALTCPRWEYQSALMRALVTKT